MSVARRHRESDHGTVHEAGHHPRQHPVHARRDDEDVGVPRQHLGERAEQPVQPGDAEVRLGQWQAIFLCEFDGPRERSLWVSVSGESGR